MPIHIKPTTRLLLASLALLMLTGCDIQPVSAGVWNIEIDTPAARETSVWRIAADGAIDFGNAPFSLSDNAVLEGSRIAWSGLASNPVAPSQALSVNFNGTVNGNALQGTVFTTAGNWTVSGVRIE